jgi:hypothetical protein
LIKRRGYSRIQRPGLIGLVLRSAPCRNRTCSPVIKSLLLLPGQRQIIFEHYGTPWRLLLRKSPRSKMLTKSEPLSSPFFVGASVRAVHPTRLERVTYSSGVCSFLNLKSGFDSRRGQDAQHQQVERVTMFYRVCFRGSRNGPFSGIVFAFPFRGCPLARRQGQRQPNPDRCGIPAPRHNLAFESPQGSEIASPASWGTAGWNFGVHIHSWGVGILCAASRQYNRCEQNRSNHST